MRRFFATTIAAALPLALSACLTDGEPAGGPVFALVNSAGFCRSGPFGNAGA